MNSGYSTPNTGLPHLSHAEPWAHSFICCDSDHAASTSRGSTPVTRFSGQHQSQPSTSTACSFDPTAAACCDEAKCPEGDHVECCTDPACNEGAICEDEGCHVPHGGGLSATDFGSEENMRELEEWACSKEGNHAIQQYLQCCTQDDCALPVCTDPHPAPVVCNHDTSSQHSANQNNLMSSGQSFNFHQPNMFDPSQLPPAPWPQPIAATNTNISSMASTPLLQHVCHWQTCHLTFGTMQELLTHVASDHLYAPNALPLDGNNIPDLAATMSMPSMQNVSTGNSVNLVNSQPFDFSNLQLDNAGVDSLMMSCLWDDCFPPAQDHSNNMFPMVDQNSQGQSSQLVNNGAAMSQAVASGNSFAQQTNQVPNITQVPIYPHPHPHPHPHPQPHPHAHTHSTGEPFSPQTMLRHVLEEHLGLSAGQLNWDTSMIPPPVPTSTPVLPSQSSTATTPILTPQHPVKPHHHHVPILPTPSPSHYTASPPPPVKPLICMWPGCTACHPFLDTASLMIHLSEEHIGKCKNTYTCLWDTCGHTGGREFKSRQKVLRHLQSHIGHKPYICDVCDQAFSEAAPLAAHKRRHAQEKPFKCDYPGCDKTFAISSSLTIHMRTHNGEKPFICPHCDKGFVEASNLTKHIRTHTGERPFACSFAGCGKRFPRPDQLKRHMAVHDADRSVKGRKGSTHGHRLSITSIP